MAELLVRAATRGVSRDGDWDKGDVVLVRPDGFAWGVRESLAAWLRSGRDRQKWPGLFVLVKVPGLSVAAAEAFTESEEGLDANGRPFYTLRRLYQCDFESLDDGRLATDWEITVDWSRTNNRQRIAAKR